MSRFLFSHLTQRGRRARLRLREPARAWTLLLLFGLAVLGVRGLAGAPADRTPSERPGAEAAILPPDTLAESGVSIPYTSFTLSNGLEVVVHEDHRLPIAAVTVLYHAGSGREEPGRTGFAHLFEHVMFEGSAHVPQGAFDRWLESAGGDNNGSTNPDYTIYYETVPSNAVELALFLEADRLGTLLDAMDQRKLDVQRDVVKNERRQRYDNQPYGLVGILLAQSLYPSGHPYHWPTIGSMSDLSAASLDDVEAFFRRWYTPGDATLVVAGDVRTDDVRRLAEKHFGDIPAPTEPPSPFFAPPARLRGETRLVYEDDVQLPRLVMAWLTPALLAPGDAGLDQVARLLAAGKSSRLYRRLVYELQIAQDVSVSQNSRKLASTFTITVTARSGHDLEEIRRVVDEELDRLRAEAPSTRETARARHLFEAGFYDGLEPALGRSVALATNDFFADDPGWFDEVLAAHRAVDASDLREAARRYLTGDRVLLSVVPKGKPDLALSGSQVAREEHP